MLIEMKKLLILSITPRQNLKNPRHTIKKCKKNAKTRHIVFFPLLPCLNHEYCTIFIRFFHTNRTSEVVTIPHHANRNEKVVNSFHYA